MGRAESRQRLHARRDRSHGDVPGVGERHRRAGRAVLARRRRHASRSLRRLLRVHARRPRRRSRRFRRAVDLTGTARAQLDRVASRRVPVPRPPVPVRLGARPRRDAHDRTRRHAGRAAGPARARPSSCRRSTAPRRGSSIRSTTGARTWNGRGRSLPAQRGGPAVDAPGRRADDRVRRRVVGPRARRGAAHHGRRARRRLLGLDRAPPLPPRLGRLRQPADEPEPRAGLRRRRRPHADRRRARPTPASPTGSTPSASPRACSSTDRSARARARCPRRRSCRLAALRDHLPERASRRRRGAAARATGGATRGRARARTSEP